MKKILVIADTHMPRFGKKIPRIILKYINEVDLIIHAGDFQTKKVYETFSHYKKVIAVQGNNDDLKLNEILPKRLIFDIEDIKVGIFHGHGLALGIYKGSNTLNRTKNEFLNDDVDLIIFGHSHIPFKEEIDSVMYFNPGSPTNKRRQPQYSFGILKVNGKTFEINHVFFDDKS